MNVDAGVLSRLPVQQREGQRHRVFDAVTAPNAGAETTVAFRQHEVLLAIAGRRRGELADQRLHLLAFEVALLVDELPSGSGARHRNRDSVGAVLALKKASERGRLDGLLAPAVAAVGGEQIFGSALVLALIVVDKDRQIEPLMNESRPLQRKSKAGPVFTGI